MTMTSYEIIKRTLTFSSPERVGLKFQSLGEGDITRIYLQPSESLRQKGQTYLVDRQAPQNYGTPDEWGVVWENKGGKLGLGQPSTAPLENLENVENFIFPDAALDTRYQGLEEVLKKAEQEEKWVQLREPYFLFERHHLLRGYENALVDLYEDEEGTEKLLDKILNYHMTVLEKINSLAKGRVHSYETSDDWGTQNALQISPHLFRKLYKPRYKKFIDKVHSFGMFFELHSCGYITDILGDLIEIGVDMVNINQPRIMNFKEISEKYSGKIVFDVGVDIQQTLPTHDREKIENEVIDLIKFWGSEKGGIIGAEYRFPESIGATKEDMEWALHCWKKHGQLR